MADDDVTPTVEDVIADVLVGASMTLPSDPLTQDDVIDWIEMKAAAAVVAAVRAMTPEQQAELIGEMTETGTFSRVVDDVPVATRVRIVGPWQVEP